MWGDPSQCFTNQYCSQAESIMKMKDKYPGYYNLKPVFTSTFDRMCYMSYGSTQERGSDRIYGYVKIAHDQACNVGSLTGVQMT